MKWTAGEFRSSALLCEAGPDKNARPEQKLRVDRGAIKLMRYGRNDQGKQGLRCRAQRSLG
jgi:hypothetical protein